MPANDTTTTPETIDSVVHYIIVRADLPHGVQVAQTAHAAGESVRHPLPDGTVVVALAVPDEAALQVIASALVAHELAHKVIVENEGPFAGQAMAIGLEPVPTHARMRVRKAVSHLRLVR